MTDTAHIFTPQDDSLEERIRAYRSAYKAHLNAEASMKFRDDDKWSDSLGERKEVEEAHKITLRSLRVASKAIKQHEFQQAVKQGLMSDSEVRDLVACKQKLEIQDIRGSKRASHSTKQSRK